ncbi:hypothetical protein E2C01_006614 [Portunus trituberculatus]|uniref:Uncharacterized protein n=1 Tax=Portunus trituberculatus TaxID=210409 RepID=A0A5B7CXT0_PORTR|nr:hypothetical protein [Portunus trituberculatus]
MDVMREQSVSKYELKCPSEEVTTELASTVYEEGKSVQTCRATLRMMGFISVAQQGNKNWNRKAPVKCWAYMENRDDSVSQSQKISVETSLLKEFKSYEGGKTETGWEFIRE